jgi:hypothetical protein
LSYDRASVSLDEWTLGLHVLSVGGIRRLRDGRGAGLLRATMILSPVLLTA